MKITFQDFTVETVEMSTLRLDGGAMFGSVPKNLWQRSIPADEENCIPLASRSLLITRGAQKILVDCGAGVKWSDKLAKIFAIETVSTQSLPFTPDEVTDVILTHMHFDHCGGISYFDGGILEPAFKNATIHVQRSNLENALAPNIREAASYLKENVHPIRDGKVHLIDGDTELFDGIELRVANGHTRGMQWLLLKDSEQTVVFPSDLIPTSHHVPLPYVMGYDICAETSLKEKKAFLEQAVSEKWRVIFQHDVDTLYSSISEDDKGRYVASDKQPLDKV
jgi:glyoxylase-like metal-dependent hydrolase (beta-lactamase superfamily II)